MEQICLFIESTNDIIDPQVWTQEIAHAYDAPLLTDSFELPDTSALGVRMLGMSLEHGLLQGVDSASTGIMLAGLEHYLKDLVQQAFEKVKRRSPEQEDVITVEDISMILESSPSCFVEVSGPLYRLNGVMLRNDDEPMDDWGGNDGSSSSSSHIMTNHDVEMANGDAVAGVKMNGEANGFGIEEPIRSSYQENERQLNSLLEDLLQGTAAE